MTGEEIVTTGATVTDAEELATRSGETAIVAVVLPTYATAVAMAAPTFVMLTDVAATLTAAEVAGPTTPAAGATRVAVAPPAATMTAEAALTYATGLLGDIVAAAASGVIASLLYG